MRSAPRFLAGVLSRDGSLIGVDFTEWRRLLAADDEYELSPGATTADLAKAEADLGTALPAEMRQVYLASNGVLHRDGHYYPVWPLSEVVRRNRQDWSLDGRAERHDLMGFGDDGTGAPFCARLAESEGVYHWQPIGGEATPLARTFAEFWAGWNAGTITT